MRHNRRTRKVHSPRCHFARTDLTAASIGSFRYRPATGPTSATGSRR
jgi:hypothetical protein